MQLPHLFISTLWENKQKHGLFPHCQHIRTLPAQTGRQPTLRVRGPLSILPRLFNSSFSKLDSKGLIKYEAPSGWIRCPRLWTFARQEPPLEGSMSERQWNHGDCFLFLHSYFTLAVTFGWSHKDSFGLSLSTSMSSGETSVVIEKNKGKQVRVCDCRGWHVQNPWGRL